MQTKTMTADDFDLSKFIKLMKMTTASTDGEALNAICMANRMLRTNGHDWEDLLKGKITIIADPFSSIPQTPPPKPAPPPPRRHPYPHAEIEGHLATIKAGLNCLTSSDIATLHTIEREWNYHKTLLQSEYYWLTHTSDRVKPTPRDVDHVNHCFDVLDLAPLSPAEISTIARIRDVWRLHKGLNDGDYRWIDLQTLRHAPRPSRKGGKAKRLI